MMANIDADIRSTFSFIWTIENFSELTYIDLKSPTFVVKTIGEAVWYIEIDEYFGFSCRIRTDDFSRETNDDIDFEFSFLGADGLPLISKRSSEPGRLFLDLMDRDAFLKRWTDFIPNNTLTVQCRMWKRDCEIPTDVCHARTRLQTHTGSFIWAIEDFSALHSSIAEDFRDINPGERKVYPLKPFTEKGPFLALILYLKQNSESEDVCVDLLIEKGRDYAFSCDLSVLDANGEIVVSKVERGRTDYGWATLSFRPLISKDKLNSNKNLFLANDTLVLRCSFEVCTGVISSELEYFTPNVFSVAGGEEEVIDFNVIEAEADYSLEFEEFFLKFIDEDEDNLVKEK